MKRLVGVVIAIAIVLGGLALWYTRWSADAHGSAAYFTRLVGETAQRPVLLAVCGSIGYEMHVYRISNDTPLGIADPGGSLEYLPRRATYQKGHTFSRWHTGPDNAEDWRLAFTALHAAREAASGSCAPHTEDLVDLLERAIRTERAHIAYSYALAGDHFEVFNFYLLDPEFGMLYDVYGAA
jgi:hypothetical protein